MSSTNYRRLSAATVERLTEHEYLNCVSTSVHEEIAATLELVIKRLSSMFDWSSTDIVSPSFAPQLFLALCEMCGRLIRLLTPDQIRAALSNDSVPEDGFLVRWLRRLSATEIQKHMPEALFGLLVHGLALMIGVSQCSNTPVESAEEQVYSDHTVSSDKSERLV
ncbi:unnamed protein product [Echinostoma caproni]|uniref:Dilute domain-containing protein n=1 Tax=Echinostoma caproni TaxID=27848 RepID=A0A183B0E7_9TREM|nr:unnamed protein product [Echinostoma caproni]